MIFIGPELSDPHAHFTTNIINSIGSGDDLIIDLFNDVERSAIFNLIEDHVNKHHDHFVIYNAFENEDFFISFKKQFPDLKLIIIFSDDEWRYANYDRYLALYADCFTITVFNHIELYRKLGLEPCYMQWACNPKEFYPLQNQAKKYEVSFIGSAYGMRIDYLRFLLKNGIDVRVFGRGWKRVPSLQARWGGYLSHKQMLNVISQSRINLNFLWTSANQKIDTIKGRTMELAACKAFQLSSYTSEFENAGFVDGENIAIFNDKSELLEKVKYFLAHDEEREDIAERGYEHVLKNHTWAQRFQHIFSYIEARSYIEAENRVYQIIVITESDVEHQIKLDDHRMNIRICSEKMFFMEFRNDIDGVIHLKRDSTINNDALYMMVFGLVADKSDLIAANFNVGSEKSYWIRFRDRIIERKRDLLRILPKECLMFSGVYVGQYRCTFQNDIKRLVVSYIEYPAFSIALPYLWARLLRLCFSYDRCARLLFERNIRKWKIISALSIAADKVWQKALYYGSGE